MNQVDYRKTFPSDTKPDVTWEEIGFAEFPVVTTSLKRPPTDTIEFAEQLGIDDQGEARFRTWKVVASREFGLPRLPDLDVFIGILKLLEQHNYERRLVVCTARDICQIAGLSRGGETYSRIKAALQRFTHTGYSAKNVFRHPGSKEVILAEDWDILSDFRLLAERQDTAIEDGLPSSYVAVSAAFLNRLKNGQRKPIDLGLWRELPLGLEKPIYHYLDKNFHGGKERHEIGLTKFGKRIALMGTYKPSKLKRLYAKPLTNLTRLGFLAGFRFEESRTPDDPEKVVFLPGPRARSQRRTEPRIPTYQKAAEPRSKERLSGNSATPEPPSDQLVTYFSLKQFGVEKISATNRERATAATILEHAKGDLDTARAIIDFAIAESRKTNFNMRTIGAVLTNTYPERAIAALEATRAATEAAVRRRAEADLKQQYETWHRAEVGRRLAGLSPQERERLVTEASEELRAGKNGAMFDQWPEQRERLVDHKVRRRIGHDLPSYNEWLSQERGAAA